MIYMMILSVRILERASSWGGGVENFPVQSNTWQVEVMSGSTGSSCAPHYTCIRSMRSLSICPNGGVRCNTFNEGLGLNWGKL